MSFVLNVVWLVLAEIWLALGQLVAAVIPAVMTVGLPFAKQSLRPPASGGRTSLLGAVAAPSSRRQQPAGSHVPLLPPWVPISLAWISYRRRGAIA